MHQHIDVSGSINTTAPNSSSQAIGIFDSGIGGLSIAKCIHTQMPHESLIYVADTRYAPYGDKSTAFIQQRVHQIADWFVEQKVKAIVIACNTATVNAIASLRESIAIPIIGVEPAIKPAAAQSKTKKVGILVTRATANNARFLALINQFKNGSEILVQPCPGLVELIEHGQKDSPACQQLLQQYLQPLLLQKVDTIVLGCTHYPLVIDDIRQFCGPSITIMETAQPVTEQLARKLNAHQLNADKGQHGSLLFYSSLPAHNQQALFAKFWPSPVPVHQLNF